MGMNAHLFAPLELRDVYFRNRIGVSAMCEYSSGESFANDWRMVHLGSRAVGGAALVLKTYSPACALVALTSLSSFVAHSSTVSQIRFRSSKLRWILVV